VSVRIERYADLAATVLAAPARLGNVRVVAVDGPAGAGKTTFAHRLASAIRDAGANVATLHTDDLLDGWADIVTFWPRLEKWILGPLRRGEPARYRRYDWHRGRFGDEWHVLPVPEVLVLEGVSSARAARPVLSRSVFVAADRQLRLARGLERDGEGLRDEWLRWMAAEDRHFAEDRTADRVDLIVEGAPDVPHDPDRELVCLLGSDGMSLTESDLRAAVAANMPGVRADLESLVRIPSIAFDGFDHAHVDRSAEAVAELLRGAGLPDVRIVRASGQPAVIGRRPAPHGAPTVLLYAHHDVQPIGDRSQWLTEPFEAVERDGRLFGRGTADDKAGIMTHVAALRAFGDDLPVGVVVFLEGEEEFGSDSLEELLLLHRDELAADVIVIADSGNWDVGQPAFTTSLRGIVNTFVEVRTLDHAVHSGMFGGAVPDALTTLCRVLATLHDYAGNVAVEGLVRRPAAPLDYPEDRFRAEAGVLDGVSLIGTGRIVDRIWTGPAISVLGIDAPRTSEAPNALIPVAKAKVSVRVAPGDDPKKAFLALQAHLDRHTPWGARTTLALEHDGAPCVIDSTGTAYDAARSAFATAWDGATPVEMGVGGSIPFIATFQEMFPHAEILVTGVEDPDSRAHGPNESLHLGEFERVCLAETLLLANVARAVSPHT
jgi:acetylornithine deacetylase/succinyl-diaminopimelate desuccinylase-like protein